MKRYCPRNKRRYKPEDLPCSVSNYTCDYEGVCHLALSKDRTIVK